MLEGYFKWILKKWNTNSNSSPATADDPTAIHSVPNASCNSL